MASLFRCLATMPLHVVTSPSACGYKGSARSRVLVVFSASNTQRELPVQYIQEIAKLLNVSHQNTQEPFSTFTLYATG